MRKSSELQSKTIVFQVWLPLFQKLASLEKHHFWRSPQEIFSDSNFPRDHITLLVSPYRISVVLLAALKKNLDGSKKNRREFHFMGLGFRVDRVVWIFAIVEL